MDPHDTIFIKHLVLYMAMIIVPMIPAIMIYKMFPDTKVNVGGPLGGLKLNAGGAFAAYVICVLLSYKVVDPAIDGLKIEENAGRTITLFKDSVAQEMKELRKDAAWKVVARLKLKEGGNDSVPPTVLPRDESERILGQLRMEITPNPLVSLITGEVSFFVPEQEMKGTSVMYSISGFATENIPLSTWGARIVDTTDRRIDLGEIVLTRPKGFASEYSAGGGGGSLDGSNTRPAP